MVQIMTEKKDDLSELIDYLEKHYAIEQSINTKGQYDHLVKRYKQVIDYLYELQEARKTFKRTSEIINMWDD